MKKIMALLISVFMMLSNVTIVHGVSKDPTKYLAQPKAIDKIVEIIKSEEFIKIKDNVSSIFAKPKDPTKYPGQSEAADAIVEAIKTNDADKIAVMFNAESRDGIKNLHQKIENLISTIGSDIISYDSTGSYQSDESDLGYRYSELGFHITITTKNENFLLNVRWITKCSSDYQKVGIKYIKLLLLDDRDNIIDFFESITLPYKNNITYKKELKLLNDGAIEEYKHDGYDSITFTSSDESVITVNSEGIVTTNGPGTAIVTETLTNTKTGKVVETEYEITVELNFWQKFIWYCLFGFLWY